jgi:hypothetical protein
MNVDYLKFGVGFFLLDMKRSLLFNRLIMKQKNLGLALAIIQSANVKSETLFAVIMAALLKSSTTLGMCDAD